MKRLILGVVLTACLPWAARAAAPAPAVLPGEAVELKTEDGWVIHGKYQAAQPGRLTIVLLHGRGQRKELWIRFAKVLEKEGLGYLAIDFRGHGESGIGPDGQPAPWRKFKVTKTQNDYEGLSRDLAAAATWLAVKAVPEESIGIVGADVGGSIGLKFAAIPAHQKIPLIVLLSPGTHYQEITTVNAVRFYKNRPILMIYSEDDRFSSRDTPVLFGFAKMAAGHKNAMLVSIPKVPGIKLPQTKAVIDQVVAWIKNPVTPETPAASTGTAVSTGPVEDSLTPDDLPAPDQNQ